LDEEGDDDGNQEEDESAIVVKSIPINELGRNSRVYI
jgi:hypothetical protein